MRLFARHDLVLLAGLTLALVVIFSPLVARLLEYTREIEQLRGLQLLPALLILATVFVFHQMWKRQEVRAEVMAAAAEARQATDRVAEMERLVALGQTLARSLEVEAIRSAATAHLPLLVPGRGVWAMIRTGQKWKPLTAVGDSSSADCERAARRALGETDPVVGTAPSDVCFPMFIAGTPVGVLGVSPEPPLVDHQRGVLAAAAAMLAVSLKNAELFRDIHENSVRDSLTGCYNRRHALEVMDGELRRARRSQMPLSLVMFDLDHFKQVNDSHGHLCGDVVLTAVGTRMKAVLRGSDLKCRYGGEEFLILLPDTPLAGARRVAETLRRAIEEQPIVWNDKSIQVTASFGVTGIRPGEVDALAIMARADAAMYRAKAAGRNRVAEAEDGVVAA